MGRKSNDTYFLMTVLEKGGSSLFEQIAARIRWTLERTGAEHAANAINYAK
jgi:hypothetical protein